LPTKEILATAELTDIAERRLDKLSGGQSQRVRFAFALAGNPELLLLDEPTVALDVESRQAFWGAMRRFAATGRTVLFATHYLEEADDYADRVIVIGQGKVVADGTGAAIKKLAGGRQVSFATSAASERLSTLAGVTSVQMRGERAVLATEDSDATVRELVLSGLSYRDLEVGGAGLEAAFLALTSKE
jgi:ABC-2 type transport system ATP-binding protein